MKKYRVDISPAGKEELWNYIEGSYDYGGKATDNILGALDDCIEFLERTPAAGTENLPYLQSKYRALRLWKHYWLIYQIYEENSTVKIEYVIDDRQNYISFIR